LIDPHRDEHQDNIGIDVASERSIDDQDDVSMFADRTSTQLSNKIAQ
jgi:hypothetical protein